MFYLLYDTEGNLKLSKARQELLCVAQKIHDFSIPRVPVYNEKSLCGKNKPAFISYIELLDILTI